MLPSAGRLLDALLELCYGGRGQAVGRLVAGWAAAAVLPVVGCTCLGECRWIRPLVVEGCVSRAWSADAGRASDGGHGAVDSRWEVLPGLVLAEQRRVRRPCVVGVAAVANLAGKVVGDDAESLRRRPAEDGALPLVRDVERGLHHRVAEAKLELVLSDERYR